MQICDKKEYLYINRFQKNYIDLNCEIMCVKDK